MTRSCEEVFEIDIREDLITVRMVEMEVTVDEIANRFIRERFHRLQQRSSGIRRDARPRFGLRVAL